MFSLIPLVLPQALVLPTVISKVLHEMLIQNTRKQNVLVQRKKYQYTFFQVDPLSQSLTQEEFWSVS